MGNFFPIVEEYNMSSAKGGDKKPVKKTTKRRPQQKKKTVVKREKFIIDCTKPVTDQIMDISALEQYFHDKIKVNGKAGQLGTKVAIAKDGDNRVIVTAQAPFSKRYLKYLTKKYLKKQGLREWLRVVSSSKNTYELRYFNIQEDEAAAEEAE